MKVVDRCCRLVVNLFVSALLLVFTLPAIAQQPGKIPRIGYLDSGGSAPPQAFVQGLRDLGYVEGKNIAIEYRSAAGNSDRVPGLAAELVPPNVLARANKVIK